MFVRDDDGALGVVVDVLGGGEAGVRPEDAVVVESRLVAVERIMSGKRLSSADEVEGVPEGFLLAETH